MGGHVHQLSYERAETTYSDHRPVLSFFQVSIKSGDVSKFEEEEDEFGFDIQMGITIDKKSFNRKSESPGQIAFSKIQDG